MDFSIGVNPHWLHQSHGETCSCLRGNVQIIQLVVFIVVLASYSESPSMSVSANEFDNIARIYIYVYGSSVSKIMDSVLSPTYYVCRRIATCARLV